VEEVKVEFGVEASMGRIYPETLSATWSTNLRIKKAKTLSASANSSRKDYYITKETESEQG